MEFHADGLLVAREADAIPLMEAIFEVGARKIILHRENIAPAFFDLRSGLAGAVLQKLTNYCISVAIVGDFSNVTSQALRAFIYESNRGRQVFFVENSAGALEKLSATGEG